jgi:hypothetical protein
MAIMEVVPIVGMARDKILRHPGRAELLLCLEILGGVAAPPYQGREEFCPAPSSACRLWRDGCLGAAQAICP